MSPELELAIAAAREAGAFLREQSESEKLVDDMLDHDIKLELDVKTQDLITRRILAKFPEHALYGEEGIAGNQESTSEWIVDPIDGTVNYFFGIPHFCVSIALREEGKLTLGAIYDPSMDELFAVDRTGPATRNGRPIQPGNRSAWKDSVVTIGFSKTRESIEAGLERYGRMARSVRKTRMMGSAALALAYIACGRLDAYIEEQISIWDIAAGMLMVERGGGEVRLTPSSSAPDCSSIIAGNGKLPLDEV